MSANRLTVACCMHGTGRLAAAIVHAVEPPGVLDGAGPEDQRAAGVPVQGHRVVRSPRRVSRAEILELVDSGHGGIGQTDQPGGPEAVVEVLVPLVAERAVRQHAFGSRRQIGERRVAPEAQAPRIRGHPDRRGAGIDREDGPGQRVFGPPAVSRRTEARVAPRAGPHVRQRIDFGVGVRLLVGDERAIGCAAGRDAVLPARLPEHLVAAEEREVHAGVRAPLRRWRADRPTSTRRGRPTGRPGGSSSWRRDDRSPRRWCS